MLQRLYPLEQPVQRPDDCPAEEEHQRVQFRPQCQPEGESSNADMYFACEGRAGQMESRDHEQADHGGRRTPAKVSQQRMLHPPPEQVRRAAASAHGITKIPTVAATGPGESCQPDSPETSWS